MKLLLFVLLSITSVNAEDLLIHRLYLPRKDPRSGVIGFANVDFKIDKSALTSFGEWEPGAGGATAVKRNQAVKIALESVGLKEGKTGVRVLVSLMSVEHWTEDRKEPPAGCSPWFYLIERKDKAVGDKERYFVVTVGGKLARMVETK